MTLIASFGTLLLAAAATAGATPYRPKQELVNGNELAFVYIGATNCGFCRDPAVKAAVMQAKSILAARAESEHRPFSATGVALDFDVDKGLEYLATLGAFDQVIVGRSWFNAAVLELLTDGSDDAILAVPQIIVYERSLQLEKTSVSAAPPRILARIPGTGIPLWVEAGVQLSGGSPEKTTPATSP